MTALVALSRLSEQLVAEGSPAFAITDLIAARLKFFDHEPLERILQTWVSVPDGPALVRRILHWHVALDTVVLTALACLLWRPSRFAGGSTALYVLADLGENTCLYLVAEKLTSPLDVPGTLLGWLGFLTFVKWAALAAAVIHLVLHRGAEWWKKRGTLGSVRGPIVVTSILAAVVLLPGGGPLEQLPDIVRAQVLDRSWRPLPPPFAASSFMILLVAAAVWLTALQTARGGGSSAREESGTEPAKPPTVAVRKLVAAVTALVVLELLRRWARSADYIVTAGFWAPAVFCTLAAVALARKRPDVALVPQADIQFGERVGLLCGAMIAALPGLGIVRALTEMVIVAAEQGAPEAPRLSWILVAGVVWSLAAPSLFVALAGLFRRVGTNAMRGQTRGTSGAATGTEFKAWLIALLGFIASTAAAALIATGYWSPVPLQPQGVVCLALLIALLGWAVVDSSPTASAAGPLTRKLTFKRRPIGALVLVTFVAAGTLNKTVSYHAVDLGAVETAPAPGRNDARATSPVNPWKLELDEWMASVKACFTSGPERVPLILVAAPGGGIRAAYWTVHGLEALAPDRCRRRFIFAISGASGGSVGATVWVGAGAQAQRRAAETGPAGAAGPTDEANGSSNAKNPSADYVARMSGTAALTQDLAAMLFRDLPVGFTGIHPTFSNRAEILEAAWEKDAPVLSADFESLREGSERDEGTQSPQLTDWWPHLLLNATDISRGCRVLITTLPLEMSTGGTTEPGPVDPRDCNRQVRPSSARHAFAVGTLDARSLMGGKEPCTVSTPRRALKASTAAHLSARFPYVSPSGGFVVCFPPITNGADRDSTAPADAPRAEDSARRRIGVDRVQVGDGGYRDNTGLSTLLELWRPLRLAVERHNAEGVGPKIVPMIVVLDNHYRSAAVADSPPRLGELAVPVRGAGAARHLAFEAVLEQAAAAAMGDSADDLPTGCSGFAVIAPNTKPGLAAPLGWVLSGVSQAALDNELESPESGLAKFTNCIDSFVAK